MYIENKSILNYKYHMEHNEIVNYLRTIDNKLITENIDKKKYDNGWRYGHGNSLCVIRPKNNQQLSDILKFCNAGKIAIIPQGGNTGLVGASVADDSHKQILLSTELLNKELLKIDKKNKTAKVGAGIILEELNDKLFDLGLFFPVDLGSKGSCNLGGMASTNAAGGHAGKYGNMLSRIISVNITFPDGTNKVFKKPDNISSHKFQDNSKINFDFPFVGSEGVLGVINELEIILEEIPKQQIPVMVVTGNEENIKVIREEINKQFPGNLSAYEGMYVKTLKIVAQNNRNLSYLFNEEELADNDYALLIELSSTQIEDLTPEIENFVMGLFEKNIIKTARLDNRNNILWQTRHHITESLSKLGKVIAFDISVKDIDNLPHFRKKAQAKIAKKYPNIIISPFGHEIIGASHFNLTWPKENLDILTKEIIFDIQKTVYDIVIEFKGSISAEHGIGPHNQKFYDFYTSSAIKEQSRKLKQKFDPNNIMNPNVNFG